MRGELEDRIRQQADYAFDSKALEATPGTYLVVTQDWAEGDNISLSLDMRCRLVKSPDGSPETAESFRALQRGPVVLARDKRLGGNIYEPVEIEADAEGYVALTPQPPAIHASMQFAVPTVGGSAFPVIDFATSGNTWSKESERVTWFPRPGQANPAKGINE